MQTWDSVAILAALKEITMTVSDLSVHVPSLKLRASCISITGSGTEKVLSVKDLFLHCGLNSILLRQPLCWPLLNYQQLPLSGSAYCLQDIGTWSSTRTYCTAWDMYRNAHWHSEKQVSECSHQRQACCEGSFRTSMMLVLSVKVQRISPHWPFSLWSALGDYRSLPCCMFYIFELL